MTLLQVAQRLKHFDEEERTYTKEEALKEANRCEQCKDAPCENGCPLQVPIKTFIKAVQDEQFDRALQLIKKQNPFPKICGRACEVHRDCVKACKLKHPVQIGKLERFVAEHGKNLSPEKIKKNKKKIAIVGAGPSGLSCASFLSQKGYNITVFEALPCKGGRLALRTPLYKLPRGIIDEEFKSVQANFRHSVAIGKTLHIKELQKGYDAILLASGAGAPVIPSIEGVEKGNIFTAHDLLMRINHMNAHQVTEHQIPIGEKIVVWGGSETAVETARTLRRLGGEVTLIFEHDHHQMTANPETLRKAKEEGLHFLLLTQIQKIKGGKDIESLECVPLMSQMTPSGEAVLTPMEDSEFTLLCDQLYLATGQHSTPLMDPETRLRQTRTGKILVDEHLRTSEEGVFAGGEVSTGTSTLAGAMADGKKAAEKIDLWMHKKLQNSDDEKTF